MYERICGAEGVSGGKLAWLVRLREPEPRLRPGRNIRIAKRGPGFRIRRLGAFTETRP